MMSIYKPSDVLLLSFPFSDTATSKRRPALVLLDTGDDDIVVARITSQAPQTKFDIQIREWQSAGLILPSVVKIHKLATLQKSLIQRQLGHLATSDWDNIYSAFLKLWTLDAL
jgi:mRNA interferase MazF